MIREVMESDLESLLELYIHLHEVGIPKNNDHLRKTWKKIIDNKDYHLIVAEEDGIIVASCTLVIVPNLTRNVSSYALVENVVTHEAYRNRGMATACLLYAQRIAESNDCYKMMLITGSTDSKTHDFYKKAGYYSDGKTAYYKTLKEVNWKH